MIVIYFLDGATFAKTMRRRGYVTVFDPIQENFGQVMGGLCLVPHIIGDLFWIGAVLSVLGKEKLLRKWLYECYLK